MRRCGFMLLVLILMISFSGCDKTIPPSEVVDGYYAVAPYGMGFLAVGSGGKAALINPDGTTSSFDALTKDHLFAISSDGQIAWGVGDYHTLVRFQGNGTGEKISGSDRSLSHYYAAAKFRDMLVVGGKSSMDVLRWQGGNTDAGVQIPTFAGVVRAVAASDELAVAVTDKSEILTSSDGITWTLLEYRTDFGEAVRFTSAVNANGMIYVAGRAGEGDSARAVLISTLMGGVWSERDLNFLDGQPADLSKTEILSLAWDGEQLYAAVGTGALLVLPDCQQCNKWQELVPTDKYRAVTYSSGLLAAVGEGDVVAVTDTDSARQYKMTPATALEKLLAGEAQIIDVREQHEWDSGHVKGATLMPLGVLEEMLAELEPDMETTLIFYCAKGVRSQSAAERARALGYMRAYSMGALEDWVGEVE